MVLNSCQFGSINLEFFFQNLKLFANICLKHSKANYMLKNVIFFWVNKPVGTEGEVSSSVSSLFSSNEASMYDSDDNFGEVICSSSSSKILAGSGSGCVD